MHQVVKFITVVMFGVFLCCSTMDQSHMVMSAVGKSIRNSHTTRPVNQVVPARPNPNSFGPLTRKVLYLGFLTAAFMGGAADTQNMNFDPKYQHLCTESKCDYEEVLGPVTNQGQYGTCWAHSFMNVLRGSILLRDSKLADSSATLTKFDMDHKQLSWCHNRGHSGTVESLESGELKIQNEGSNFHRVANALMRSQLGVHQGIQGDFVNTCQPKIVSCANKRWMLGYADIATSGWLRGYTPEEIEASVKQALMEHGPLYLSILLGEDADSLRRISHKNNPADIDNSDDVKKCSIDNSQDVDLSKCSGHAITLAGFGSAKNGEQWWKIKNSWGGGYAYIKKTALATKFLLRRGVFAIAPDMRKIQQHEESRQQYKCDDIISSEEAHLKLLHKKTVKKADLKILVNNLPLHADDDSMYRVTLPFKDFQHGDVLTKINGQSLDYNKEKASVNSWTNGITHQFSHIQSVISNAPDEVEVEFAREGDVCNDLLEEASKEYSIFKVDFRMVDSFTELFVYDSLFCEAEAMRKCNEHPECDGYFFDPKNRQFKLFGEMGLKDTSLSAFLDWPCYTCKGKRVEKTTRNQLQNEDVNTDSRKVIGVKNSKLKEIQERPAPSDTWEGRAKKKAVEALSLDLHLFGKPYNLYMGAAVVGAAKTLVSGNLDTKTLITNVNSAMGTVDCVTVGKKNCLQTDK